MEIETKSNNTSNSNSNSNSQPIRKIVYPFSEKYCSIWFADDFKSRERDYGDQLLPEPTYELRSKWLQEQRKIAQSILIKNDFNWNLDTKSPNCLKYIGGVDISFAKNSKIDACASVIITQFPECNVIYETYYMVKLKQPYVAGFLAFREVPFIQEILERLKKEKPDIFPQVLMVDGNGFLHMRGCGQACHLGVVSGIPCLGVAKKLLYADGITDQVVSDAFYYKPKPMYDLHDSKAAVLVGDSGIARAIAYKVRTNQGTNIIYISPGHKIDLVTCLALVKMCLKGNILPEPVFQADKLSRDFLYLNYRYMK